MAKIIAVAGHCKDANVHIETHKGGQDRGAKTMHVIYKNKANFNGAAGHCKGANICNAGTHIKVKSLCTVGLTYM